MAIAQHSSKSAEWYTPQNVINLSKKVLGDIDLDPASCVQANTIIGANKFWTKEDNALSKDWTDFHVTQTVFLNSPGGKIGNKSIPVLFWNKLTQMRQAGALEHAIVIAFSIEQLATTQKCEVPMADFTLCIPKKRMQFVSPDGLKTSPTCSNAIIYVPGNRNVKDQFAREFSSIGAILEPMF